MGTTRLYADRDVGVRGTDLDIVSSDLAAVVDCVCKDVDVQFGGTGIMMKERLHRTQLLLEPEQHRALAKIARDEGRSISDVVRDMIRQQLERRTREANADLERQLAALERIRHHRDQILSRTGGKPLDVDLITLIDRMREEQDAASAVGPGDLRG